jgi:hypothetical protein
VAEWSGSNRKDGLQLRQFYFKTIFNFCDNFFGMNNCHKKLNKVFNSQVFVLIQFSLRELYKKKIASTHRGLAIISITNPNQI